MALVQFRNDEGATYTKRMAAPKKAAQIEAWWKAVRKVLPMVPNGDDPHGWMLQHTQISPKWITWELKHFSTRKTCRVVIDRSQPSIG